MTALESVVNHLWQSTAFAAVVWLATLAVRRNRAAVRHALWLAASIKFLVPFAALVALGGVFGLRAAAPAVHREFTIVVNNPDHALPFSPLDFAAPASFATAAPPGISALLAVGLALWIAGALAILGVWAIRWRRVSAITRAAARIEDGRDLAVLRDIERQAGRMKPITFVSSDASLEPGVFGIFRPVLVWPKSIAEHLGENQIATILAHEVSHVRRRDNLAAAVHMIVEALFWFHPMVWWIGGRLVDERERACDEAVLQAGSAPEIYAETIVKACRIYVESPLACVAGVTGSDLNRRIERIMTNGHAQALSPWRKVLLAGCVFAVVATPVAIGAATPPRPRVERVERRASGPFALRVKQPLMLEVSPQATAALPRFEVASIKRNNSDRSPVRIQTSPGGRFTAVNVTLKGLVQFAYRLQSFQVNGGPSWIDSDRFDIVAKGDEKEEGNLQLMLRALLADRFKVIVHADSRELPMYALILARADGRLGSDLRRSTADCSGANPQAIDKSRTADANAVPCGIRLGLGTMGMGGATMTQLATTLSGLMERSVVDRTGLTGAFDGSLKWTPDQSTPGLALKSSYAPPGLVDPNGASLFTAVQEQLGLKLDAQKGPVDVMVIDRAEHPIEN